MKFSMLKRTFYSVRKTRALSSPAQPEEIELRTSGQNNMPKKTKELLVGQRHAAFLILADHIDPSSKSGVEWGELSRVAKIFGVDRSAICRFWRDARARMAKENRSLDDVTKDQTFFQPRQHERGRKKKYNRKQLRREVKQLRFKQRRNFRALSVATGVPPTTIHRMMTKENVFRRHISALKPTLTEENKVSRVVYCLEEIHPVLNEDGECFYKNLFDRVDVDERWFHMTRDNEKYIVVDSDHDDDTETEEDAPVRRTRHKGYIGKVMFLCAQARPRWDPHRNSWWDGKLGIWPIGDYRPAQRTSERRPAGTLEWHDIAVTRAVYRRYLQEKVLPAIETKWPRREWNDPRIIIRIQQDGPQSHIKPNDTEWVKTLEDKGLGNKVLLFTQPGNSPDLNINDLGLFRALQSAYLQFTPSTAEDIIRYVRRAHAEYPRHKINRIWLTLMSCMSCIISHGGDNDYNIPHLGKERLERRNELPVTLPAPDKAKEYLGLI